jgi:hypothetical protein
MHRVSSNMQNAPIAGSSIGMSPGGGMSLPVITAPQAMLLPASVTIETDQREMHVLVDGESGMTTVTAAPLGGGDRRSPSPNNNPLAS